MIQPIAYRRKLEGKSNTHLIAFNDGKEYCVKFFQREFEKALPNEWIAYCLGRFLGLPIPFAKIVQIPRDFFEQVPDLGQLEYNPFQFASTFIPGCSDGHEVPEVPKFLNANTLAGIILFDYWLCNTDRTRKNILLRKETSESYQLWIIDHAEILGFYQWNVTDLKKLPVEMLKSATHQFMASYIENEEEFKKQLKIIQNIPVLLLEEIVSLIPEEWNITKEERKVIVNVLFERQRKVLPDLMKKFIKKVYCQIRMDTQNFHAQ